MLKDFLRALAASLRGLVGEDYPLYYGRVLQGAAEPCFLLTPPEVSRRALSSGRVLREYGVDLRFYPGKDPDLYSQQSMGESLICALDELFGEERNYRGRELKYQPGEQYLSFSAHYEFYTVKELEQAADRELNRDMMLELGFEIGKIE